MLIALPVWDTVQNGRTTLTERTLKSLHRTVNFTRHRLIVCDNGSCNETLDLYKRMHKRFEFHVILNRENLGQSVAMNMAWVKREPGENCVKMDNDVEIWEQDWPDLMDMVFAKDPTIGICGLKRKDVWESPENPHPHGDYFRSTLKMLPHTPGERWIVVEEVNHVMGTCQGYSSLLLDKIGLMYQMQDLGNLYGFDDSLSSYRAKAAGFKNVFLPHVPIDHIDPGGNRYAEWKRQMASDFMPHFNRIREEYTSGKRDPYYAGP